MMATAYKEMYKPDQTVEVDGRFGRVLYHDPVTHFVHVLFKTNTNAWKLEKCDDLHCKPAQIFLWSTENVFCVKHQRRYRTPTLVPVKADDDCVMEL